MHAAAAASTALRRRFRDPSTASPAIDTRVHARLKKRRQPAREQGGHVLVSARTSAKEEPDTLMPCLEGARAQGSRHYLKSPNRARARLAGTQARRSCRASAGRSLNRRARAWRVHEHDAVAGLEAAGGREEARDRLRGGERAVAGDAVRDVALRVQVAVHRPVRVRLHVAPQRVHNPVPARACHEGSTRMSFPVCNLKRHYATSGTPASTGALSMLRRSASTVQLRMALHTWAGHTHACSGSAVHWANQVRLQVAHRLFCSAAGVLLGNTRMPALPLALSDVHLCISHAVTRSANGTLVPLMSGPPRDLDTTGACPGLLDLRKT